MITKDEAVSQLSVLLTQHDADNAARKARGTWTASSLALAHRLHAAITRLSGVDSAYIRDLERVRSQYQHDRISELLGLVSITRALRDDIAAGWLTSVVEMAHADTYTSYLEQAEGLNSQGYKDPAAVIAGISLEVHLKALATKHGVDLQMTNGHQKMASGLNDDLKREGVYNALEHKQVTAWLAIRNSAAHGDFGEYDTAAVKGLIEGVRNFAVRHPA